MIARPARHLGRSSTSCRGGLFLTPATSGTCRSRARSIAIMATGMVLIIVSRNIDLSVGSMLGFIGYSMAMVQTEWIPKTFGLGFDQPYTWIIALAVGLALGAADRRCPGLHHRLRRRPVVHRHARRLARLARPRSSSSRRARRSPRSTRRSSCSAAGPTGSLGESLQLARRRASPCVGDRLQPRAPRRRRRGTASRVRPMWAEIAARRRRLRRRRRRGLGRQQLPLARQPGPAVRPGAQHPDPPGGLIIPTGIAYPVLILIGVAVVDDLPGDAAAASAATSTPSAATPRPPSSAASTPAGRSCCTFVLMGVLVRGQRGDPDGPPQRGGHRTSACRTSSTSSPPRSSAARRSPAASGRSPAPSSARSSCSRCGRAWSCSRSTRRSQDIVVGIVLVAAVGLDSLRSRRRSHAERQADRHEPSRSRVTRRR